MIPRTFTKIQLNNIYNFKNCKNNCLCTNKLKILSTKIPLNIIDDVFIKIQFKEYIKEYNQCYSKKLHN